MLRFIELLSVDLKSMTQFLKYTAIQVLIWCTYALRSVPIARKFPMNSKDDTSHSYSLPFLSTSPKPYGTLYILSFSKGERISMGPDPLNFIVKWSMSR